MRFPTGYIICAAIGFGLLGAAKGLDEGLIAITVNLPSFVREYGLDASDLSAAAKANRLSNITSMVHLGSLPAAFLAFLLSDFIGPLWTMRQLCLLWIIGAIIVITSVGNYSQLIGGRFIMGLGMGQAGIIGPIYLAEVAPTAWRGLLVGIYASSEYIGILIGYFAGYGASLHLSDYSDQQWIIPQSCQIMLAGVLLLFSVGCVESPRYLCKANRTDQAARALGRLRRLPSDSPSIVEEVREIQRQAAAVQSKEGRRSLQLLEPWKLLFGQAANRYRLLFLLSAQLLSQWSGTNAITTYAPKFFSLLGVTGQSEKLLKTAIFGAVKLAAALICAIFFIDQIGRKRSLMSGITLQLLALLYIAIFLTVTSSLSVDTHSGAAHRAAIAAIASIYVTGIGYAFGWNSVQYLINAEMLPSSVRTLGTSILMCIHYANRFALTKAVPTMMLADALQPKGTFWFFFVVAFLGFLWGMFLLPETSRKNLEETSEMIR
ncbi:general substrate transporter [Aspergillus ibericus CBS 121593]|uniref:General substrate transporter n=1 Tax=Aspergillus ibericus CBS 121593 TaxID=1448316 RepID=A0A395GWS6_9EURO|nr:general substrate transporter [Aspergillus ibericus CBS 121593]RAK98503.1 general substrate transporter [Aspergillus ibericus CBS 121593]